MNVDWHHFFRIQQWMSSLTDADAAFGVKLRSHTVVLFRQLSLGKDKIQFCQNIEVVPDKWDVFGSQVAKVCQDHVYFFFFLQEKFF